MSIRLCPRCSTLIESGTSIFCYNCGQELPRPAPREEVVDSSKTPVRVIKKKSAGKRNLRLTLFSAALLSVLLALSLLYSTVIRGRNLGSFQKDSVNEYVSTISALPVSPYSFGRQSLASLAPANVTLYLESSNPKLFLQKRLGPTGRALLETKVGLNLDEIASFFETEFAYIEASNSAALIGVGKDPEFLKERAGKLSGEKIKAQVLDNYFVVATSATLLKDVEGAYKKTALPLTLTAKFQETLRRLPREGQLLIYGESQDDARAALRYYFGNKLSAAFTALSGTSFVVNGVSGSTVIKGLNAD